MAEGLRRAHRRRRRLQLQPHPRPGDRLALSRELANVDKIETPDDYTVVIRLKTPDGNFLHQVANYHQGQIVNKKAIEAAGRQGALEPGGNGPLSTSTSSTSTHASSSSATRITSAARRRSRRSSSRSSRTKHGDHRAAQRRDRPHDALQPRGEHRDPREGGLQDEQGRELRGRAQGLQHVVQAAVRRARPPGASPTPSTTTPSTRPPRPACRRPRTRC